MIGVSSCRKNKWKLPTEMKTIVNITNDVSTNNNISFKSGNISITEFSFNGEREQGDDVYFTKTFAGGIEIPFSVATVSELKFDIPQGTYSKISISFSTNSIAVNGEINNSNNSSKNNRQLKFEFNDKENFSIIAQNKDGNNEIILNKDIPVTAYITFNPEYWFRTISESMLNHTTNTMDEETEEDIILINEETNSSLYDIAVNRISDGVNIVIK